MRKLSCQLSIQTILASLLLALLIGPLFTATTLAAEAKAEKKAAPTAEKKVEPAKKKVAQSATKPVPVNVKWWTYRQAELNERIKLGQVDLLFIGDSINHGWDGGGKEVWNKYYAKRKAANAGFGGDQTQNVLWRLDNGNIKGIKPKLIPIMIGTNNSGGNKPEEIAEGIRLIVEKLRKKLPESKILLCAIFPRGEKTDDRHRKVNDATNEIIKNFADGENVIYFDFNDKFLDDDGTLPKDIMPDLLHPNTKGYYIWAEAIEPFVAKYVGGAPELDEKGFVSIFDGKTLDGWHTKGNKPDNRASYEVLDGAIVGKVNPKAQKNTFLCTDKKYANFVLKLEFKLGTPNCNSGVQIRSHLKPDGTVFGYQVEIDPSERSWTGGIYDESRRGWLFDFRKDDMALQRSAMKPGDWNQLEIQANGPTIKTWVNGVPCAKLTDDADTEGFIGLQVHSGKEGQVFWRNIRIKELPETK
jgi:lysophospholipase L1-like esterase